MPSGDGRERLLALRGSDNYIREWLATGYWTKSLSPRVFAPHWSAFFQGKLHGLWRQQWDRRLPAAVLAAARMFTRTTLPPYHWRSACRRHRVGISAQTPTEFASGILALMPTITTVLEARRATATILMWVMRFANQIELFMTISPGSPGSTATHAALRDSYSSAGQRTRPGSGRPA